MNKHLKLLALTLCLTSLPMLSHAEDEIDIPLPATAEVADSKKADDAQSVPLDRIIVLVEEGLVTQSELDERLSQIRRSLAAKQVQSVSGGNDAGYFRMAKLTRLN